MRIPSSRCSTRSIRAIVDAINHHFGLAFDPDGRDHPLTKWTVIREPPYLVHTGFELVLMIDGRKPFTRMGGNSYPPHQYYDEDLFDRYVALGILHKEVQLEPFAEPLRYGTAASSRVCAPSTTR